MVTSTKAELIVRRVYASESRQMLALLAPLLNEAPYSMAMNHLDLFDQCFQPAPPTLHEVRWLHHDILGAWDGELLLGFIDIGIGYDHATLHLDGERPIGLLRFLALDRDFLIANRAAKVLIEAAELVWREAGVRRVRAYSLSTGYPSFQSGAGMLPGVWEDHLNRLTGAGYRLSERYYCLCFPLQRMVAETLPEGVYTHRRQHLGAEFRYQIFEGDSEIATARLLKRQVIQPEKVNPVAYAANLAVAPPWRRRGIGHWLLRRMLNDAYLLGCQQFVAHVNHAEHAAISLFYQVGFEEISYRGYTLEKRL